MLLFVLQLGAEVPSFWVSPFSLGPQTGYLQNIRRLFNFLHQECLHHVFFRCRQLYLDEVASSVLRPRPPASDRSAALPCVREQRRLVFVITVGLLSFIVDICPSFFSFRLISFVPFLFLNTGVMRLDSIKAVLYVVCQREESVRE